MVVPMINIVVPLAGRGSRFRDAGYSVPKPLVPILGSPMTEIVIANLRPAQDHRFIFPVLRETIEMFAFDRLLEQWAPGSVNIAVDGVTQGAACTVLLARGLINTNEPLMIANCDQWVDVDINDYLGALSCGAADGLIMTMSADDPKWSYVRLDEALRPIEVVEKRVVSNTATVGIYSFRQGREFVSAAEQMIAKDCRVN